MTVPLSLDIAAVVADVATAGVTVGEVAPAFAVVVVALVATVLEVDAAFEDADVVDGVGFEPDEPGAVVVEATLETVDEAAPDSEVPALVESQPLRTAENRAHPNCKNVLNAQSFTFMIIHSHLQEP